MLADSPRITPGSPREFLGPPGRPAMVGPIPATDSPMGRFLETWLPVILAAVSFGVGWQVSPSFGYESSVPYSLAPAAATLLLRMLMTRRAHRRGPGDPLLTGLFVLHQALVLLTVALNPLACIYAFTGYIDASRFLTGRTALGSVIVTAMICAFGQSGGPTGVAAVPALFVLLLLVNVLLSLGMGYLADERERQVAAREQAARELDLATRENQALQEELLRRARESGVLAERTRLAREIHDTVAQGLVGVIRQLEALPADAVGASARQRIAIAEDTARECLVDARRAVEALAPQQLGEGDLVEVLGELVGRWARAHRVVATFDADEAPHPCPHPHVLIRVTQEALANVARHSRADSVEIVLAADDGDALLRIRDDGTGFDPATARTGGHGLRSMRERVVEVGGELAVEAAPGRGTVITARVPR